MMKRLLLLTLLLVSATINQYARERTETEKLTIAQRALSNTDRESEQIGKIKKVKESKNYSIYQATTGHGFVIVGNDSELAEVLGWSEGNYNESNLPEGFKWWLSATDYNLSLYKQDFIQTEKSIAGKAIPSFITTIWGQNNPFNMYCPYVDGTTAPTGCVATAMAQVMNYYEYPAQGNGVGGYSVTDNKGTTTEKQTEINGTYNWAILKDEYLSESAMSERLAVARLMSDCGASVNMNYKSTSSSAVQLDAAIALGNNFGYCSAAIRYYERVFYTETEWENLIYDELSSKRPILYSGLDNTVGGHAFVLDGIDETGKVHVNWGWNGAANGFYDFKYLRPDISGVTQDFSSNMSMVCGIKPFKSSASEVPASQWVTNKKYIFNVYEQSDLVFSLGNIYNISPSAFRGDIAVTIESVAEERATTKRLILFSSQAYEDEGIDGTIMPQYGFRFEEEDGSLMSLNLTNNINNLQNGKYRLYVSTKGYSENEQWQYLRCPGGQLIYTLEKNADGTINVYDGDPLVSNGIEGVTTDKGGAPKSIYNLNGMRMPSMKSGLNLIRQTDGTIKKVMMK